MILTKGANQQKSAAVFMLANPSRNIGLHVVAGHAGVNKGLDFIWENFSRPIQLKDLVDVSGMSRRGFCKAFKKDVGVNPGSFLRSIRIEQAKWLLVEHDLKLKQIASQCGFRSENTFCVAFLREIKTSPKKFQRQYWLAACRERHKNYGSLLPSNRRFGPDNVGNLPNRLNPSKTISLHESQIF